LQSRVGTSSGFVGCVREFKLGKKPIALHSDQDPMVMQRTGVVECEENPCVRLPCGEGGSCSVKEQGFQCECNKEFTGRRCQRRRNQCHPNPCKNHGQCVRDDTGTFQCMCKAGHGGRLCETKPEKEERIKKRYGQKVCPFQWHFCNSNPFSVPTPTPDRSCPSASASRPTTTS
jgi:hypothetical protein